MRVFFLILAAMAVSYAAFFQLEIYAGRIAAGVFALATAAGFLIWFGNAFMHAIQANKRDRASEVEAHADCGTPSSRWRALGQAILYFMVFMVMAGVADAFFGIEGVEATSILFAGAAGAAFVLHAARNGRPLPTENQGEWVQHNPFEVGEWQHRDEQARGPYYSHLSYGGHYDSNQWRSVYDD